MNRTHEIIKIIFACASMLYFIIQLAMIAPWRKRISKKTGDLVLKTATPKKANAIIVLILCPILILFSLITKATFFVCCLMSVLAALACFINCRELVFGKLNGVYKNGLIGAARFTSFDEIDSYPDTSWKEPEKQDTVSLAIKLKAPTEKKSAVLFIDYASIVEYVKVVNTIKDLKQNK